MLHSPHASGFIATCIVFLTLTWVMMVLRSLARLWIMGVFRVDDGLATLSLFLCTGSCACALAGFEASRGKSFDTLLFVFESLYVASTWAIMLSFTFSVRPLLHNRLHMAVATIVGLAITVYSRFYLCWSLVQCYRPGAKNTCLAAQVIPSYVHAGLLIACDIALAALCVQIISGLQFKTSKKLSVLLPLLMGPSPIITTILRTLYISSLGDPIDTPDQGPRILFSIFTVTEMGFCIIATAATTLRPLFTRLKLLSSSDHTSTSRRTRTHPHMHTPTFPSRTASVLCCSKREFGNGDDEEEVGLNDVPPVARKIYVTRDFQLNVPGEPE
ncbi:hypothetical protein BJX64DRAFT_300858 [Aspergillus heterothallicus]